jgi:NAD(P)H dehydrogenase (quinone)
MSTKTKTVAVVYFSGSGHNEEMARAVAKGAGSVAGVKVETLRIVGEEIDKGRWKNDETLAKLTAADAIIFGAPTYMAGPAAQFKAFADATGMIWYQRGWKGKLAGGFSHSNSPAGDKANTLNYFQGLAAQHGMNWVNNPELPYMYVGGTNGMNRYGFYAGAAGGTVHSPGQPVVVDPGDLLTAETYGKHVAESALKWNG